MWGTFPFPKYRLILTPMKQTTFDIIMTKGELAHQLYSIIIYSLIDILRYFLSRYRLLQILYEEMVKQRHIYYEMHIYYEEPRPSNILSNQT